jgi:hypothetical protein
MTALGRNDLIFPVHYLNVEKVQASGTAFGVALADLRRQQWSEFRPHLYTDPRSPEVKRGGRAIGRDRS